ncbi:nuclear transport factor 2 family protein [Arthrobacter crystallopoietes]|uniref:nuclear transport factor 2 family protein n=1 Tax=Crystallibacter crystallopoietes TaxID=37928 RepID=UPI001ABEADA2|nr:nuclear transport factor 2 family protein [Arthrobacter crystallopoietes]QTG79432.1 nuclear transport factor 2 family protein [Arthrobacter crystallopoietes]
MTQQESGYGAEAPRTIQEVLNSHLHHRTVGDLEGDLRENYADDVVLLSAEGVHRGHDGVRHLADILQSYIQDGSYQFHKLLTDGEIGMLVWTGSTDELKIHDGVDSFVVRDGRITAQTIHYSTRR